MEILKKMSFKLKTAALLVLAGLAVAFVAFRRHVADALLPNDLEKKEDELRAAADDKLKKEVQEIEQKKGEEIVKVEEQKEVEEEKIEKKEVEEKKTLVELAKKDRIAFRNTVDRKLGVKQKKTPGRKPRK